MGERPKSVEETLRDLEKFDKRCRKIGLDHRKVSEGKYIKDMRSRNCTDSVVRGFSEDERRRRVESYEEYSRHYR